MSVMQQAFLCCTLGMVSVAAWCLLRVIHVHSRHAFALGFTVFFVAVLGTYIASIWLGYDLRTGIESERWPEEQINNFRAAFSAPLAWAVYAAATIAAFLLLFYDLISHNHHREMGSGLMLLSQNFSQLLIAARRPKSRHPLQRIDWRSAPRITSDHWGEHN